MASSSYVVAVASLVAGVLFAIVVNISGRRNKVRRPPGPAALPIIGHLHLLSPKVHQTFDNFCKRNGPIVGIRLGSTPAVVVGSVAAAAEFFKTHDVIFSDRPQTIASRRFAYDDVGFAFAPYEAYWKFVKKLAMTERLSVRTVEQLLSVRRQELAAFLERLTEAARRRRAVDVSHDLIKMTNNIVSRMTIGRTCAPADGELGDPEESMKLVKQVAELMGSLNLCDHVWFLRHWDLRGLNRRIEGVLSRFDAMLERIIKQKGAAREAREEAAAGRDLLDILLDASENVAAEEIKLKRQNVKAIVIDLLSAGSDSSAVTLEWALVELINHPEMLQKAQEEVDRVAGRERPVEETDIAGMPYIQAVVRETLRLHPPATLAGRLCREDVAVCGYHILAGTNVFINLWSLGKDPEQWEDPLEFRPERFANGGDDLSPQLRMLPFGGGRRICPGSALAMQLVQTALAAMLQSFEWKHIERLDMEEGIGLVVPKANPLVCVPVARWSHATLERPTEGPPFPPFVLERP